jgi:drug/metabolite transporter (DMT)-like permease
MNLANALWLALFTLVLAVGQLLFKQVGLAMKGLSMVDSFAAAARSPALYAALFLYGGSTLLWIWLLSRLTLSQAYPWAAIGVAIVPLLARLVFGERVAGMYWIGIVFVVVGMLLTQYAASGE